MSDPSKPSMLDRLFRHLGEIEIGARLARTLGPENLADIVARLETEGFADTVQHWREGATTQTLTAHAMIAALGDLLRDLADEFGFEPAELAEVLVNNLPAAVHHVAVAG